MDILADDDDDIKKLEDLDTAIQNKKRILVKMKL